MPDGKLYLVTRQLDKQTFEIKEKLVRKIKWKNSYRWSLFLAPKCFRNVAIIHSHLICEGY
jgi:hypothetical protein